MNSSDLMEYVPDDVYDMEYDKRYNPMAKKAKGSRKKGSGVALNEKIKGNKESLFHLTSETSSRPPRGRRPRSSPWSGRLSHTTSSLKLVPMSKRWART